jgi:ribulose 1,5-bisphosphate synthetase/thiazole synthase
MSDLKKAPRSRHLVKPIKISERHYDAVVLGSGPSGRTVALRLANNSLSVALVENELVGEDRAYWA